MKNNLKTRIARGDVLAGMFSVIVSPTALEVCSYQGFDWFIIDGEAGALSRPELLHLLMAANGRVPCVVRVSSLYQPEIEHALDLGAAGVLVPKVDNRAMAELAVAAAKYPPRGRRGVNPIRASRYFQDVDGYMAQANQDTLCLVQIETAEAVENVREICTVEGIDGVFVGPGDLATALGFPGQVDHASVADARRGVLEAARDAGKPAGIHAYSNDLARQHIAEGFQLITLGNEVKFLQEGVMQALHAFRDGTAGR